MAKPKFLIVSVLCFNLFYYSCEDNLDNQNINDDKIITDSLTATEKSVVASNNNFAFELFQEINIQDTTENMFISPLSIGMALAMTFNGADGETKEEMKAVLGFQNVADSSLNIAYQGVYDQLMDMDEKVNISLANSIWYDQTFTVKQNFVDIIENYYDGIVSPIDISDPNSKDIINSWVEDKTNDKIHDLVKEIKSGDAMFLVNAIYFKADWTYIFDENKTRETDFYREDGTIVTCQMMRSGEISIKNRYNDNFQLIELPYGNKQFGMVIIIPNTDKTPDDIIGILSVDDIDNMLSDTNRTAITVNMPKFKIEYEYLLNDVLISMGMERAFDGSQAEFPLLLEEFKEGLFISRVNHKAFIEVDEKGTEAAAATVVVITWESATPEITIDRPFIYLIRENHTGAVLFIGKMDDPS